MLGGETLGQVARVLVPDTLFVINICVTLGKTTSQCLSFFICTMEMIPESASKVCCED